METISVSAFKARISEQLRKVRLGAHVVITDRDTPIAEVVPMEIEPSVIVRSPRQKPFAAPPISAVTSHDPLEYLFEDRGRR